MIQIINRNGYSEQDGTIQILNSSYPNNTAQTSPYINWINLVTGYKTAPTLNATIAEGDVYNYIYETNTTDLTYYRLVPSGIADDAFYSSFLGSVLNGLIITKKITINN